MKKRAKAVTVIGGADGPTSIFLVGKQRGILGIWQKIQSRRYQQKQKKAMAGIKVDPHTIEELVSYITGKYKAEELPQDNRRYQMARKSCRTNLVQRFAPELAGVPEKIQPPVGRDEASIKEYMARVDAQLERAAAVPEEAFPMDFHIYHIRYKGDSHIFLEIETLHSYIGVTSSGDMGEVHKVEKDIFLYYGVGRADIEQRTERFQMLASILTQR